MADPGALAGEATADLLWALLPACSPMRARLVIRGVVRAEVHLNTDAGRAATRDAAAEFGRRLYTAGWVARASHPRGVPRLEIEGLAPPHVFVMTAAWPCGEHGLDFRRPVRRWPR